MAKFNITQYNMGRSRGMYLAYQEYLEKGIEYLAADIDFRKRTYIDVDAPTSEMKEVSAMIYNCIFQSGYVMFMNCLRDEFNFGHERAQRFTERYEQIREEMIVMDFPCWLSVYDSTLKKLKISFSVGDGQGRAPKSDYRNGRIRGMEICLEEIMKGNEKSLKAQIDDRTKVHLSIKKMAKQSDDVTKYVQSFCYDCVLVFLMKALNESCGFGKIRLDRLFKRWDYMAESLNPNDETVDILDTHYFNWEDLLWVVREEMKINPPVNYMISRGLIMGEAV